MCFVGRIDCCALALFLSAAIDDDCNGGHEKFYTTFLINGKTARSSGKHFSNFINRYAL